MNKIQTLLDGDTLLVQVPEEDLPKITRVIVFGHPYYKEFCKDDEEGEKRC